METISNQLLLLKKTVCLDNFQDNLNPSDFPNSISCLYHGIQLNFKTKNKKFITSLQNLIPKEWICEPNEQTIIYLMTPADFGYTLEEWSHETSQNCVTFKNNSVAIQRDFAALKSNRHVYLICEGAVGDGFYNFLRWYLSERLISLDKYVVHASAVLDKKGNAHLFMGHSGAGKTTITQLAHPRLVLGDDMNLISIENNVLYVEAGAIGGQFNSMIGYDKKIPIKACYWLRQNNVNVRHVLDTKTANQKLLASFANLHWPTLPQEKIDQLMLFSMEATYCSQFYELNFQETTSIWDYLDP